VATLAELQTRLEALRQLRALGAREVELSDGRRTRFGSDAEIGAAIADLERQITAVTATPVTTVLVSASKGLESE
jgi:hypothetical protein